MAEYVVQVPAQLSPLLRAIRRSRGLTQGQVAARLGVTRQAVSELERRPHAAVFERLMRLCTILGVDIVLRTAGPREG